MDKRESQRFAKRLEVRFSSGGMSYSGFSGNLSENGLFIRTKRGFAPGSTIDIELVLPDGTVSFLKGIVRRTIKAAASVKNGMGIELLQKDVRYVDFVRTLSPDAEKGSEDIAPPGFQILSCPKCGTRNKVLGNKIALRPRCGRCSSSLIPEEEERKKPRFDIGDADRFISQGMYGEAVEVYRELISVEPNNVSIMQRIVEFQALLKLLGKDKNGLIASLNSFLDQEKVVP